MTKTEAKSLLPGGARINVLINTTRRLVPNKYHRQHVENLIDGCLALRRTPACVKRSDQYGIALDTHSGTIFVETKK